MPDNLIELDTVRISQQGDANSSKLTIGAANIIRGWYVIIEGLNVLPSTTITIVADTVEFAAGAMLDTSGQNGIPDYPSQKPATSPPGQAGTTFGASNPDKGNGGKGGNGGNVTIIARSIKGTVSVRAVGGNGGRGGDGGDGGGGVVNPGAGGPAGLSGDAGNGGEVHIQTYEISSVQVNAVLNPGSPGPAATPGQPGTYSYIIRQYEDINGPKSASRYYPMHEITVGASAPSAAPGATGATGSVNFNQIIPADFAVACSATQMKKILAFAEYCYINDDIKSASDRLLFVSTLARL